MDEKQLDKWRKLADEATPGPWKKSTGEPPWYMGDETIFCNTQSGNRRVLLQLNTNFDCKADAIFIAAAREAVPALISEVEVLQAEVNRLYLQNAALRGEATYWRDWWLSTDKTS